MAEFGIRARLRFLWEQSLGGSSPLSPTRFLNNQDTNYEKQISFKFQKTNNLSTHFLDLLILGFYWKLEIEIWKLRA
ncbi:MAG: hypothetical protein US57_C0014G0014 [Candidatus Moranbacteria bacterium GW2011_GWC2_37_73]|nr:MAG: hypothetical protein UR95_C0002G0034 [Parcubacteria group bacterium GW2011_GWC1_36_108]KKQ01388.1 MAG: hypothetical protein US10_C0014G0014 [Candidatus Moranbacteria bacterium GW2011_GWD2_36_198]KKQ39391.1 MAG: hypothetical protein US57_C0014G0014 [Candidatus Moranbacteria bacterium GW2011_GWC2_37_73]